MLHNRGLIVLVAALALGTAPAVTGQQSTRHAMYVSVVDADGAPVPDVTVNDLVVREDNTTREILDIRPANEPMQIALVVDNSQAAQAWIQNIRIGLQDFVTTMTSSEPKNQLAILTIGDRPTIVTDYALDRKVLLDGVGRIFSQPGSGMYLLDTLVDVSHGLIKRGATRPKIVALLTSGIEFSTRYYRDVLSAIADSGATFYALTLGPPSSSMVDEIRNRDRVLAEGTANSGGTTEMVLAPTAIQERLKTLANQLQHEYLVTYSRPESLIPPEKITVAAKKPGVTARGTPVKNQQKEQPDR